MSKRERNMYFGPSLGHNKRFDFVSNPFDRQYINVYLPYN